jgi:hypothetical protein
MMRRRVMIKIGGGRNCGAPDRGARRPPIGVVRYL